MENTLAQKAYLAIRDQLRAGALPPGSRLVNRALAEELGFSFTPVREAISRLASEGLVEYVPGAGAFVRKPGRQELAQLYDLRSILEPYAAAQSARHVSAVELEELWRVCGEFRDIVKALGEGRRSAASARQRKAWLRAEERFHELLIQAARNPWLTKIAVELRLGSLVFSAHLSVNELITTEVAERTLREHERLVEKLQERDADGARACMESHIQGGRRHVLSLFSKAES